MKTHMVHAQVDVRELKKWAVQRKLMKRWVFDEGWALHVLLSGMFGKGVLQPFRVFGSDRRRTGTLYAYANDDEHVLQETARTVAPPEYCSILMPETVRTKQMPQTFQPGQRLGFELRARPVRRVYEDVQDTRHGEVVKKGSEVDAYWLDKLRNSADDPTESMTQREHCYHAWLAARLTKVAEVKACRIRSFRRAKVVRGQKVVEGPDVLLHGDLEIGDAEKFARAVRQGIGRHKAYGYGMLLLRPVGRRMKEGSQLG